MGSIKTAYEAYEAISDIGALFSIAKQLSPCIPLLRMNSIFTCSKRNNSEDINQKEDYHIIFVDMAYIIEKSIKIFKLQWLLTFYSAFTI